jgi:predicted nucleotidyltransferase
VLVHLLERLLPGRDDVRPAAAAVSQGLIEARLARFGPDAVPLNIPVGPGGVVSHGVGPKGMEPALLTAARAAAEDAVAAARAEAAEAAAAAAAGAEGAHGGGGADPHGPEAVAAHAAAARKVRGQTPAAPGAANGAPAAADGAPQAQAQAQAEAQAQAALPYGLIASPAAYSEDWDAAAQLQATAELMGLFDALAAPRSAAKRVAWTKRSYVAPPHPNAIATKPAAGHLATVVLACVWLAQQQLGGGVTEAALRYLLQKRREAGVTVGRKGGGRKAGGGKGGRPPLAGEVALVDALETLPEVLAGLVASGRLSSGPCAWPGLGATYAPAAPPPSPHAVKAALRRAGDADAAAVVVEDAVHSLCAAPGVSGADVVAFCRGFDGPLSRQLPVGAPDAAARTAAAIACAAPSELTHTRLTHEAWGRASLDPSMVGRFFAGRAPAPAAVADSVAALIASAPPETGGKRAYKAAAAAHRSALKALAPPLPIAPGFAFGVDKKKKGGGSGGDAEGEEADEEEEDAGLGSGDGSGSGSEDDAGAAEAPAAAAKAAKQPAAASGGSGGGAPLAVFEDRGGSAWSLGGGKGGAAVAVAAAVAAPAAAAAKPAAATKPAQAKQEAAEDSSSSGDGDSDSGSESDSSSDSDSSSEDAVAAAPAPAAAGGRRLAGAEALYAAMLARVSEAAVSEAAAATSRSALHGEVAAFAAAAAPRPHELTLLRTALAELNAAARALWPAARVLLFGSQAGGLSLPGSDLDLVVLVPGGPVARPADGFGARQRPEVLRRLQALRKELRRRGLLFPGDPVNVIQARVRTAGFELKGRGLEERFQAGRRQA